MTLRRQTKGFGLIELVITVAVFAIIASIAIPSYTQFVLKGNRADAKETLLRVAQQQERFFYTTGAAGAPVYTADLTNLGYNAASPLSDEGHYQITANVDNVNGSFTLTATATAGSQARDTNCLTIILFSTGQKDSTSGAACW